MGDTGEDPGIQACMPLWIFGSEIITLIDQWNCPLKLEGKYKPKLKESTSAQRGSSGFSCILWDGKSNLKDSEGLLSRTSSSHCQTELGAFPIRSSVSHLLDYTNQKGVTTQIPAQKLTNGVTLGGRGSHRSLKRSKPHTSSLANQEGLSLTPFCQLTPHRSPNWLPPLVSSEPGTPPRQHPRPDIHVLTVEKPLSGCFPHYLQGPTHFV